MLSRDGISCLRDLIPGPANLDDIPPDRDLRADHANRQAGDGVGASAALFLLAGSAAREVRLMLAALSVGEVGAVILVDGQAEAAFEGADVVLEEVGVFVQVDGFQGELAQPLASVGVGGGGRGDTSAAELGACAVLIVHCGGCEAGV